MTRATLEKSMVFPKTSKNRATEPRVLPLMGYYIGQTENQQETDTPQFRAALFTTKSTSVHLKYPRTEKKIDKEVVVLTYYGISLSHGINVIKPVAA